MKNKSIILLPAILLFSFSIFFFNKYVNFDTLSAILFIVITGFLVIINRKKLDFQILLKISKLPLLYAVLWRTEFGLKFMDRFASRFRELIKLLGYCFIGFGFYGMIFISINMIFLLFNLFLSPKEASQGVSLVLPLTNIPGLGYLSFWHFLIAIFVTVLIHEFAHGILARAHNIPIKSSGIGVFSILLPIFPIAFVEPDEKKLIKEKDVVQYSIFAAGPMANIILAFIILLLFPYVSNPNLSAPFEEKITYPIGFSFNDVMDDFSAMKQGMKPGMIINEVNGVEVLSYQDFSDEIGILKPNQELTLDTTNGTFTLIAKPSPDNPKTGLMGIQDIRNERRIKDEYKSISVPFFWLKSLIKWLFLINLMIGLINLLPLMITDGGRMLKTALEKNFKDAKKANKLWVLIGVFFIFTLLFALVIRYTFQFFLL
jgi:membrane-associated protease RseP (regulator of RpoE activity)|tara:strand:+ start:6626 stop:7915 length:1290 start_codon:yes stop_codon:yes gene_type:complete